MVQSRRARRARNLLCRIFSAITYVVLCNEGFEYIHIYLSIYLYLSLSISIDLYLSISISIYLSIYLSLYLSIYMYISGPVEAREARAELALQDLQRDHLPDSRIQIQS